MCVKKIADLESDFDENEELIGPSHLDRMHSLVIPYEQNDKVCMCVCVKKIADLESDFDENEELIGPSHLDRMHSLVIPYDQNDKVRIQSK